MDEYQTQHVRWDLSIANEIKLGSRYAIFKRSLFPNAVQMLLATKDQLISTDRCGGPEDLVVESIRRNQFELWSRRDYVSNSGIVQ